MEPLPDVLACDDVMIREGPDGLFWTAVPGMHAVNYCFPQQESLVVPTNRPYGVLWTYSKI